MEVGGKRHALAALPPGKRPSTPCTEVRVGLLMSRYYNHAIPTTLTSRFIYRIYFIWMKSRTNKPIHNTASKTDKTRQAMNMK